MFGFLNINKPQGITSRDVVNQIQRIVRPAKVGHAGTLDPLATGVLVVAIGPATRLIEFVQQSRKHYYGEFLLGHTSDTEDVEGEICVLAGAPQPSRMEIEAVLPRFLGMIQQRPPVYSALKVKGQRAYDLAREGKSVALASRPVEVHSLQLGEYVYPRMALEIACGSGTYVRSLGRDIAIALGTGAIMTGLVRTQVGPFTLDNSLTTEALSVEKIQQSLHSPLDAVRHLPQLQIGERDEARLARGQSIEVDFHGQCQHLVATDRHGSLCAILVNRGATWGPKINFSRPSSE